MADASLVILCVNSGSSSLKGALYRIGRDEEEQLARSERPVDDAGHRAALEAVLDDLDTAGASAPRAAGHRVVHGGPRHVEPVLVDDALLDDLESVVGLAPLHLPPAITGIECVRERFPDLPQVVCFDTAFHEGMPERSRRLPIPSALAEAGIRRYGFHGLSYEYVVGAIGAQQLGRAVLAHLGNGASMVAVRGGVPIDTTMALTPAGGLMMSSRTGDVDPGVLVYLLRARGYDADSLEMLVERESGLLAVSGTSGDMRELLETRATDRNAALAVDMFCTRARAQIGAYAALLGGLDTLVFTGGIGERAAAVRAEICDGLSHLGIEIDRDRNAADAAIISTDDAACRVHVVETNEDVVIARHAARLLAAR